MRRETQRPLKQANRDLDNARKNLTIEDRQLGRRSKTRKR